MEANSDFEHEGTRRRLLIAKSLFLHGVERLRDGGELNRLLAVHGLHNAVESVLHAIALEFDIRGEKHLNVTFDVLLKDIDNCQVMVAKDQRLPYRAEVRNLNVSRNLALHHAYPPDEAAIEQLSYVVERFLVSVYREYFGVEFRAIDTCTFVQDEVLRRILTESKRCLSEGKWTKSGALSKVAADLAIVSVSKIVTPLRQVGSFRDTNLRYARVEDHNLARGLEQLCEQIDDLRRRFIITATGVRLNDYRRLEECPILVFIGGGTIASVRWRGSIAEDYAEWLYRFIVEQILRWQEVGLVPTVEDRMNGPVSAWIEEFSQIEFGPKDG